MNDQLKKDLEIIKMSLDEATKKGVFANIDTAYTVSIAYNNVFNELNKQPDGTN